MGDASSMLPPATPAPQEAVPPMDTPAPDGMGGEPGAELSGKVKEIADTANEISEKDQETLLAYARSLKDASESAGAGQENGETPSEPTPPMPMNESVIFTKGQVRKINESLGNVDFDREHEKEVGHSTKTKNKNS